MKPGNKKIESHQTFNSLKLVPQGRIPYECLRFESWEGGLTFIGSHKEQRAEDNTSSYCLSLPLSVFLIPLFFRKV